jgi:energy-coupling factor transport system permease protein
MSRLDPRVQLAWLLVSIVAALFGGEAGLVAAAVLAGIGVVGGRLVAPWARVALAVAPLALVVGLLDALAGEPATGARVAARLIAVASLSVVFAHTANGEALVAGLRALRVPYPMVFTLVAGARFVPSLTADLASLRDAARLRGLELDGPPWRQLAGWRVVLVPLLVGTVRRGLQLGEAMEARAFGASAGRTVRHQLRWRRRDSAALVGALLFGALVAVAEAAASRPR